MRPFIRGVAILFLVSAMGSCSPAADEAATEEPAAEQEAVEDSEDTASLYDRLGGEEAITAIVDRFIDVLSDDDLLNANPAILAARDHADPDQLKALVTAFVCQASGGPQEYTGRSMADSHADMNISGAEWDQMILQFVAVLDEFGVPDAEQGELLAIMDSTKADIVVRPDE